MTVRNLATLAAAGSAALLLAALGSQYLGGLDPCKLCIWQRWPHGAAIAAGVLFALLPAATLLVAGALAAATTSGIGFYHMGIEQGWWQGPDSCTGGGLTDLSAEDALAELLGRPTVLCSDIAWSFGPLSMAGWNAVISATLAALWIWAFVIDRQSPR